MAHPPSAVMRRAVVLILITAAAASARSSDEPIRLEWEEGEVAGTTLIYEPGGDEPIGTVEYQQTRQGDRLKTRRVSHFRDGSSDEDVAEARVDGMLEAISGRTIIRDEKGEIVVRMSIDVAAQRLKAEWRDEDGERHTMDEEADLPKSTYWGPLVHIVLKNFDANEERGRVVFHTVAPTPQPRAIDMEFRRGGVEKVERPGMTFEARRFALSPTIHWIVDPLVRRIAPRVSFWMSATKPPMLGQFVGPRNYSGQRIRIQ